MIASSVIMIRPACFGYNTETEPSNSFQHQVQISPAEIQQRALKEFDALVEKLKEKKIRVDVFEDSASPQKPDSIFPNNWFSTHRNQKIILYPMLSPLRRLERRQDILTSISSEVEIIDLTHYEREGKFLEGTGSLVFDHKNKTIYSNLSSRTNSTLVDLVAHELGYEPITFKAFDKNENEIYHTNVMMSMSDDLAIVCLDTVKENRHDFEIALRQSEKKLIEISLEQMENFCGNVLMLQNEIGKKFLVMSERAFQNFTSAQKSIITKYAEIIFSPLDTIETIGGGSARCMLAENFLSIP